MSCKYMCGCVQECVHIGKVIVATCIYRFVDVWC